MNTKQIAYLQIHFCIVLWGLTAILGKLISLESGFILVWWRLLIAVAGMFLLPAVWRGLRTISRRETLRVGAVGLIVAAHWVCFYAAIKASNASIAVSCLATTSFFTANLEPLIERRAYRWRELLLGLAIVPGIALIVGFAPEGYGGGIVLGLCAALAAALFSTLNKRLLRNIDPFAYTTVQLSAGLVGLTLVLPFFVWQSGCAFVPALATDWLWLFVLSILCTVLPYILSLVALRELSAFTINLALNLEPIYSIVLAWLLFQENKELHWTFYLGIAIILSAIAAHPLLSKTDVQEV